MAPSSADSTMIAKPAVTHVRSVVRQAHVDDAVALSALAKRVFRESYGAAIPEAILVPYLARAFAPEAFCAMLADPTVTVLVATVDGTIGGYGKLARAHALATQENGPVIELSTLYIEHTYRGKGLGKALMHAALTWAAHERYGTMALCVWRENRWALTFYEQFGFAITGTTEILVDSIVFQDWVMTRPITGNHPLSHCNR